MSDCSLNIAGFSLQCEYVLADEYIDGVNLHDVTATINSHVEDVVTVKFNSISLTKGKVAWAISELDKQEIDFTLQFEGSEFTLRLQRPTLAVTSTIALDRNTHDSSYAFAAKFENTNDAPERLKQFLRELLKYI